MILSSISLAVLIFTIAYVGWYANLGAALNSDGIVNTYLFQDFKFNNMLIPGNHTLLIKWPLFALQSLFPYGFTSYAVLNYFLLFATIMGWVAGLTVIFGKRFLPAIAALFTLLLIGSNIFPSNLVFGSLRNIEYPIGLAFMIMFSRLLVVKNISKKMLYTAVGIGIAFSFALASDSLMLISFGAPPVVALAIYFYKGGALNKRYLMLLGYLISSIVLGFALPRLIFYLHLAIPFYADSLKPKIVSFDVLLPSIPYAFQQLYHITGADVNDKEVRITNALFFCKFLAQTLSLVGLILVLKELKNSTYKQLATLKFLPIALLVISFVLTMGAYIAFGEVYQKMPDGSLVDASQSRYIELLPMITIAGLLVLYNYIRPQRKRIVVVGFFVILVVSGLLSSHRVQFENNLIDGVTHDAINLQQKIGSIVAENKVEFIASGYWDGATTKFWSSTNVDYMSIGQCNHMDPLINTRLSWSTDKNYSKTALLIDRFGSSKGHWLCTDDQLEAIYGQPNKIIVVQPGSNDHHVLWIYDYDIREKLVSK